MIGRNETYTDMRIVLDGATFVGCTFERCTFVYTGILPVSFVGNKLLDCNWQFTGAAGAALEFMAGIYAMDGNGAAVVEQIFASVRANAARMPRRN